MATMAKPKALAMPSRLIAPGPEPMLPMTAAPQPKNDDRMHRPDNSRAADRRIDETSPRRRFMAACLAFLLDRHPPRPICRTRQSAGRPPPPEPVEGAEESPGSIRMRRRITSGGGDPRESATESKPPKAGREARQGKGESRHWPEVIRAPLEGGRSSTADVQPRFGGVQPALEGVDPTESGAPVGQSHNRDAETRMLIERGLFGRVPPTALAAPLGDLRASPSFGGIGSTQSLGGRGSFRPLVGIGAQPFGGRGPGAIGPQPFIGRGPQTPSGGMQGDRR